MYLHSAALVLLNGRTHVHPSAPARAGSRISRERNEGIPLVTSLGGLNFYHWVIEKEK